MRKAVIRLRSWERSNGERQVNAIVAELDDALFWRGRLGPLCADSERIRDESVAFNYFLVAFNLWTL
jgi:hypothetical protein